MDAQNTAMKQAIAIARGAWALHRVGEIDWLLRLWNLHQRPADPWK